MKMLRKYIVATPVSIFAILSVAVCFSAVASADNAQSGTHKGATRTAGLLVSKDLPAFAQPRTSSDVVPGGAALFTTRKSLDVGNSRRLVVNDSQAIFAAPSTDDSTVCFATTDITIRSWAATICNPTSTLRSNPLLWSLNLTGPPSNPKEVFVWGIASADTASVSVQEGIQSVKTTPNSDGAFLIELSGTMTHPDAITAQNSSGATIATDTVPAFS